MDPKPLVSIALATHNGERYLAQQMDSLLAQDYPNLEIVISDDGSTDGSRNILQSYVDRDERLRLLPPAANLGYVENFIRVFMACKGDLISPSDQDDIWYPHKTRRLEEALGKAALVYCNNRFIDESNNFLGRNFSDVTSMLSGNDSRNLLFGSSICGHAMLFRKELLHAAEALNSLPYIDLMIAFLAMENGYVTYHDEVLVDWRHHSESTSFYNWNTSQSSRIKAIETDEKIISALSSIPGKHQKFAISSRHKLEKWKSRYFDLSMLFFVMRYGHITHRAHPAKYPALKYLVGYKLKKLLRPSYY
jgi:glycosyltransferase involved in cell wall biosynthesis